MTSVELATKTCSKCGEKKPVSDFYRNRSARDGLYAACKPCHRTTSDAAKERTRAEMGEAAWLRHQRRVVDRHRRKTGGAYDRAYNRARTAAVRVLIERHRAEFEHLLLLARRGELGGEA